MEWVSVARVQRGLSVIPVGVPCVPAAPLGLEVFRVCRPVLRAPIPLAYVCMQTRPAVQCVGLCVSCVMRGTTMRAMVEVVWRAVLEHTMTCAGRWGSFSAIPVGQGPMLRNQALV